MAIGQRLEALVASPYIKYLVNYVSMDAPMRSEKKIKTQKQTNVKWNFSMQTNMH